MIEKYMWIDPNYLEDDLSTFTISLERIIELFGTHSSYSENNFVYPLTHAMIMSPVLPNMNSMFHTFREVASCGVVGLLNERGLTMGSIHTPPKTVNDWTLYYADHSICVEHKLTMLP